MIRKTLTLITPLLAVAALAPAAASAAQLHGAPTMRVIDGGRVQLQFAVDKKLPTNKAGKDTTKISVNGKPVAFLKRAGRHGRDFKYTALVAGTGLEVGKKYTARFHVPDGTVTRLVKLHPKSSY
jgi:hypothetical protein